MAETLESSLGYQTLTAAIASPKGGVPAHVIPPGFIDNVVPNDGGDTAKWNQYADTRVAAIVRDYGADALPRENTGFTERIMKCIHSVESTKHKVSTLEALRSFDNPAKQRRGEQLLAIETKQSRGRLNNLRLGQFFSIMRHGKIYVGANGNLLPTSTGAKVTIDCEIPAANIGNARISEWDQAGTDILAQLAEVKLHGIKQSGLPIEECFYGKSIPGRILANTNAKELMKSNSTLTTALTSGVIPDNFGGIKKWRPAHEAFMEDANGVQTEWFGGDYLSFCPAGSPEWIQTIEGSYSVPTQIAVSADAAAAAGMFESVWGMFSYAYIKLNAPGIEQVYGDTFLTVLVIPSALQIVADAAAAAS